MLEELDSYVVGLQPYPMQGYVVVEVPPCGVLQDVPLEIVPGPVYVVAVEVYVEDAIDVSLLGVLVEVS